MKKVANKKMLKLIEEQKYLKSLLGQTGYNQKELLLKIRDLISCGYQIESLYFSDRGRQFIWDKSLPCKAMKDETIKINVVKNHFRFLAISDLHFGSAKETPELLYSLYNYATKHSIASIFNLGDLIDGHVRKNTKSSKTSYEDQINHLLTDYPFDPAIINYVLYGNHDLSSLTESGIYLPNILEQNRADFVNVGVVSDYIKVADEYIKLSHPFHNSPFETGTSYKDYESPLELVGHMHTFGTRYNGNHLAIMIPTLSNLKLNHYLFVKGALDISLILDKNKRMEHILIKQLNVRKDTTKPINQIYY